ncbi:RagB/SusD family nutrient uptake outer membrane protein [Pedobacter heparinus]|uniref:RagB/SusD domain protein n=1 Tax=Pedobacter heparinus (strain ATCC 13125 / DSM 2366 / CIP 104194 / JCM 7457 / NBRC 12017 / NCIMB 9290 / NRRL B-14731 / HIM 762-3) TaxID=485917 RepID=C6Y0D3_PEDHD|nr:RagB/SusD family nutrient uptake outer membrane protein [Pedobacter heparinus]ACU04845.1 RagB/SusD domain protein [Pedobacter heparinus DSM 2366]
MKKLHIAILLYLMGSLTSCKEDLQLTPISQISNASFWKTLDDAKGAQVGMYVRLRSQMASNYYLLGEARSDVLDKSIAGVGNYIYYYQNSLIKSTPGLPTWQGLYTVVHDANLILKYIPDIAINSVSAKNEILAQAYAMRAFVYFTMVKTWGDLPLITEPTESFNAERIQRPRTDKAEIFKLIKNDIEEALRLYPNNNYTTGRFFWSRAATNALKADVYLWTGKMLNGGTTDFNIALTAINDAETSDVALLEPFSSIFDYANKGNKEIMMATRFQVSESPVNIYQDMYMSATFMTNNTDAATKAAIGIFGGQPYTNISNTARLQFTNDDVRKNASFIEIYLNDANHTYYGSVISKFRGTVVSGVRQFQDDIIIYRYGDLILMKAEAKNALGQDPSAEINKIRKRAYGANYNAHIFINGAKEQNDEAILTERLLELVFEGKRWWDLVRFGKAFEKIPSLQSRTGQTHLLLFPIAESTLSLEPKVTPNPGYE